MSLFPFLIFVAALAGFLGWEDLGKAATRVVFAEWPPVVARPIAEQVSNVLKQRHGGLLTLGAVLACYFASSAIEALRRRGGSYPATGRAAEILRAAVHGPDRRRGR